jgi:hypothetical protein
LDVSRLVAKGAIKAAKASQIDMGKVATMLLNFPQLQVRGVVDKTTDIVCTCDVLSIACIISATTNMNHFDSA